jgi:hypothetical protein
VLLIRRQLFYCDEAATSAATRFSWGDASFLFSILADEAATLIAKSAAAVPIFQLLKEQR